MLDSFFSGKKTKKAAVKEAVASAPAETAVEEEQTGLTLSAVTSNMVIGAKGVWIDDSEDKEAMDLANLAGALKLGVAEEDTFEASAETDAFDAEAAETKRKLWQALKDSQKSKGQAPAPAPAPAASTKFVPTHLRDSASKAAGKIDITSSELFPSLIPQAETKSAKASTGPAKGQWAILDSGNSDDEDEAAPAAPAAAPVKSAWGAASVAALPSGASSVFRPAPAPAPAPAVAAPAPAPAPAPAAAPSVRAGTGKLLSSAADIRDETVKIAYEAKTSHDTAEAVRRVAEMNVGSDLEKRSVAVETFLQCGIDADADADRNAIGAVLAALVSGYAMTKEAFKAGVVTFLATYDDISCDYPKLPDYLSILLAGCLELIPAAVIPEPVQKKMGIFKAEEEGGDDPFAGKKKKKKNMAALSDALGDE